ncbi:MAG: ribonuclease H-like domain-containing protein, partial [Treponemataceae bacterium]|nr:ribonuclease H-like domain-containing protein [Treponemataceae bacterium]
AHTDAAEGTAIVEGGTLPPLSPEPTSLFSFPISEETPRLTDERDNKEKISPKTFPFPWECCVPLVWRHVMFRNFPENFPVHNEFTTSLPRLLWESLPAVTLEEKGRKEIGRGDFCFFDLETTGLSGGAGTIIFLAAFGDVLSDGSLRITQYILEDFPGEYAFLEAIHQELVQRQKEGKILVTYNGKCFDLPLLRSRGSMHRLVFPELDHIDLLYPARLLWKREQGPCSLAALEDRLLHRPRENDIPGELAPLYWFHFLKSGDISGLLQVAIHNQRDVETLYYLCLRVALILLNPLMALETEEADVEALAIRWYRRYVKEGIPLCPGGGRSEKQGVFPLENKIMPAQTDVPSRREVLGVEKRQFFYERIHDLSHAIAKKGTCRFPLHWSAFFLRHGTIEEARHIVLSTVEKIGDPLYRYRCYRALAIIDEWYRRDYPHVIEWLKKMEELVETFPGKFSVSEREYQRIREELIQRKRRVEKKSGPSPFKKYVIP